MIETTANTAVAGEPHPWLISITNPSIAQAIGEQGASTAYAQPYYQRTGYDAFGRVTLVRAQDGVSDTTTKYKVEESIPSGPYLVTTEVSDPNDNDTTTPIDADVGTPTTTRVDGHGRVVEQVLRYRPALPVNGPITLHRLVTTYRADGVVTLLQRGEGNPFSSSVTRSFTYDTAGRRIGTTDPDTESPSIYGRSDQAKNWRYFFNKVGDLVAVRDPRQCGQNFYYDHAGRLIGEDYVTCDEAQIADETPPSVDDVPVNAIADGLITSTHPVDVRYYFDSTPSWATGNYAPGTTYPAGRLTATSDRGQRSTITYDRRGNVTRTARAMVIIPTPLALGNPTQDPPELVGETTAGTVARAWDDGGGTSSHIYVRRGTYDHGGRPVEVFLPEDPDWNLNESLNPVKLVSGKILYYGSGSPSRISYQIATASERSAGTGVNVYLPSDIVYRPDGQVHYANYGDGALTAYKARFWNTYDVRQRPTRIQVLRNSTSGTLGSITVPFDRFYVWDRGSNLTETYDAMPVAQTIAGHRNQRILIQHDTLYRVTGATFQYNNGSGYTTSNTDTSAGAWRASLTQTNGDGSTHQAADPMRPSAAPMLPTSPATRVASLKWAYDWLGNMTSWTDDQSNFYERSIGTIHNGNSTALGVTRPSALHLATNITTMTHAGNPTVDRGGWVELDYGEGGNVTRMTVHAQCHDLSPVTACFDPGGAATTRRSALRSNCVCSREQSYHYRWDELNRLAEARRYDRPGVGVWTLAARQRYRYDSANQRTIKQTVPVPTDIMGGFELDRSTLYVYPGDFERRGLRRTGTAYTADGVLDTETHYMIGGARITWQTTMNPTGLDRNHRVTLPLQDLLGSSSAVVDLDSGELLEQSTYYPNGARETRRTQTAVSHALTSEGFTAKEDDSAVGATYFGQRWLLHHVGRWASADPLAIARVGGGEALNGFHYVGGNLLQARDPHGLDVLFGEIDYHDENGAVTLNVELHRAGPENLTHAAHRLELVSRLREGLRALYDRQIRLARRAGASPAVVRSLTRERNLAVRSIRGAEIDSDGHFRLRLDTREMDRRYGNRAQWQYRRLREAATDRGRVIVLGFDRGNAVAARGGGGASSTIEDPTGRGRRAATAGVVLDDRVNAHGGGATRDEVHELIGHAVSRTREPPENPGHDDRDPAPPDNRNDDDRIDDVLRDAIPSPGEGPVHTPPEWDWDPDRAATGASTTPAPNKSP